jgi:hypothetical protein
MSTSYEVGALFKGKTTPAIGRSNSAGGGRRSSWQFVPTAVVEEDRRRFRAPGRRPSAPRRHS